MNKLMTELLIEEFDDIFEDVINEEMNDKQRKSALKKLKAGMVYKELPSIFKEKDTILAAGLSVDMVQNDIGKKYADAYKTFKKYTTDQAIFGSAKHAENIAKAKEAKAIMKKYYGRVLKIQKDLAKGSKKFASNASKASVDKINANRKEIVSNETKKAQTAAAAKAKREAKKIQKIKDAKKAEKNAKKQEFITKTKQKLAKINFAKR